MRPNESHLLNSRNILKLLILSAVGAVDVAIATIDRDSFAALLITTFNTISYVEFVFGNVLVQFCARIMFGIALFALHHFTVCHFREVYLAVVDLLLINFIRHFRNLNIKTGLIRHSSWWTCLFIVFFSAAVVSIPLMTINTTFLTQRNRRTLTNSRLVCNCVSDLVFFRIIRLVCFHLRLGIF